MRKAADIMSEQRNELSALMAMEVGKNRLEALGDVEESADLHPLERERDREERRLPQADAVARLAGRVLRRAAAVRRVGRDQPVQLPDGARGRSLERRARRRQHRRVQAGAPGRVHRPEAVRDLHGGRRPEGRLPLPVGPRQRRRRRDREPPRRRRDHVHRLVRGRDGDLQGLREGLPEAGRSARWAARTRRSSRTRPTSTRRPTACCARRSGSAGRSARPARACTCTAACTTSSCACSKEKTEKIKVGDPLDRDVYLGPVIDEGAVATFEEAAAEAKKNGTVVTGGERLTEGEFAKGTFVQPTVVEVPLDSWIWKQGAVRAVRRGRRRRRPRRGDRAWPTTPSTASPPASTARTAPRSTRG